MRKRGVPRVWGWYSTDFCRVLILYGLFWQKLRNRADARTDGRADACFRELFGRGGTPRLRAAALFLAASADCEEPGPTRSRAVRGPVSVLAYTIHGTDRCAGREQVLRDRSRYLALPRLAEFRGYRGRSSLLGARSDYLRSAPAATCIPATNSACTKASPKSALAGSNSRSSSHTMQQYPEPTNHALSFKSASRRS